MQDENILPNRLRDHADRWSLMIVDFYRLWVASGCPDYFQHEIQPDHRLVVTSHSQTTYPVLMHSVKEWRPFEQRNCWTLSKPWGGVLKHPTMWFMEVVNELLEVSEQEVS